MVKEYRILMLIAWALALAMITGCASSGGNKMANSKKRLPPGLDSTTVWDSGKVADANFVSARREQEAEKHHTIAKQNSEKVDEFWAYLENSSKPKDLTNSEKAQFDREFANGAKALEQWKQITANGQRNQMAEEAKIACLSAKQHLEQAIRLNPFDKNVRMLLAVTYYNLQHIFGQDSNYERAVEILERLVRIEKGEPELYRSLAENYMAMHRWEDAAQQFLKAEFVLKKTAFEAPPDTSKLFYYAYMQGDMTARMQQANPAIALFKKAQLYARTQGEKDDVENYIKWVNWDGGQIANSESWDRVLAFEQNKQYPQLEQEANRLIPQLRTKKAKLAVHHKLAVAEFEFLNKKPKAIERMKRVYESLQPEEVATPSEEVTAYLNTYGAMLFRFGVEAREHHENKLALAYFTKATEFEWDQVAKPNFELVTLVWNSPEKAIVYGKNAIKAAEGLSEYEMCQLISLMVKAHKSAGMYDDARTYFNQWKTCQKGQTQDAE
ncbi:MAG: hypothetical protein H6696_08010 [Deferribacteres bacterium]|nr:hypothetical protein [candidate division KSB1 bacterium]MCB9501866.1 hypothetical protein [Deferribacteres bacterium]